MNDTSGNWAVRVYYDVIENYFILIGCLGWETTRVVVHFGMETLGFFCGMFPGEGVLLRR